MTRPKAAIVRFLERHLVTQERVSRFLVKHLVKFEVGPPKDTQVDRHGCDEDGNLLIGVNVDTHKLQLFMRFFAWTLKPLRWLP